MKITLSPEVSTMAWNSWYDVNKRDTDRYWFDTFLKERHCITHDWTNDHTNLVAEFEDESFYTLFLLSI